MRKRRVSINDSQESEQTLRVLLNGAVEAQQKLPESIEGISAPDPIPEELSKISSTNDVRDLSNEQLSEYLTQIQSVTAEVSANIQKWDLFGKNLKNALDATLMMISIKSEPTISKRRRTNVVDYSEPDVETPYSSKITPQPSVVVDLVSNQPPAVKSESFQPTTQESIDDNSKEKQKTGSVNYDVTVGRQVAFKLPGSLVDEWIQCEVTKIITPGYRLEVRDPEPDDHGNPGKSYQCRVKDIILLPLPGQSVKPLPVGSVVLAQYPETTAFYKARVCSYNPKRRVYSLRFEGEDDIRKETEVSDILVVQNKR